MLLAPVGAKDKSDKDVRNGIFKHKYISNPTVTAADVVIAAAQNMAEALKKKRTAISTTKLSQPSPTYEKSSPTPPQTKKQPRIRHNIRPKQK